MSEMFDWEVSDGVDVLRQQGSVFVRDAESGKPGIFLAELEFVRKEHDATLRHCLLKLDSAPPMLFQVLFSKHHIVDATLFFDFFFLLPLFS